jgi:outer membrane protein OmpA-like peptidoglycan-associated protein
MASAVLRAVRPPEPAAATTQRAVSNQGMQDLLRSRSLQTKLTVNTPGDQMEGEADQVADQVMRMSSGSMGEPPPSIQRMCTSCSNEIMERPIQRMCKECDDEVHRKEASNASLGISSTHGPLGVQRVCDECEEEVQRAESSHSEPALTTVIESQVLALQSSGEPLPGRARSFFEPRFGRDFSAVRVHADAAAAATAQSVNALAYTRGNHIVFAAGHYSPDTTAGRRLIAHELAHTIQQRAVGESYSIQRAPCPRPATHIGDTPVEASLECTQRTDTVGGAIFLFCTDSDLLQDASEALLPPLIPVLRQMSVVEVHGYASPEGPAGREAQYNLNLSCKRANRAADMLEGQGIPRGRIRTFKHGGTLALGGPEQNRSVTIPVANQHTFRTSAVSMLACAPCNPFTDDGLTALSPPAAESALASFRQRHEMSAMILSVDNQHIDPGSPGIVSAGSTVGRTGFCGREFPAFEVSRSAPSGVGTAVNSTVHGEGREWQSDLSSRVGAVVPCTLVDPLGGPGAPCGSLGPNASIPAIRSRFFMRLFADGTAESGFVAGSTTTFPFHYIYENGTLKTSGSRPVSALVDFNSWATSTGVSIRDALVGFKALRAVCCRGPIGCPCECRGGESVLSRESIDPENPAANLLACAGSGLAFLTMSCPDPCTQMGTPCDVLNRPANP